MKFLSVEKRSRSPSLHVNISLATVTSSRVTSSKLKIPRNGNINICYEIFMSGRGFRDSNITLKIQKINAV